MCFIAEQISLPYQSKSYSNKHVITISLRPYILVSVLVEDESCESSHFVTNEDPSQKLKWQAHLEFTQNQELGELTWDKVRVCGYNFMVLTFDA